MLPRIAAKKLLRNALVLLLVPLSFEILVTTTLMVLQDRYVEAVKLETLRKRIMLHANEMADQTAHIGSDAILVYVMQNAQQANSLLPHYRSFVQNYEALKSLIKEPARLASLAELKVEVDRFYEETRPITARLERSAPERLRSTKSVGKSVLHLGKVFREFEKPLIAESNSAALATERQKQILKIAIVCSIVLSFALALVLFRFFVRGVYSGILALKSDIENFRAGKSLAPAAVGNDEFAELHQRFVAMAEELREVQRMKQEFARTIAEDMRVPLARVSKYVNQLQTSAFGDLPKLTVEGAERTSQSISRLINLLDDLFRIATSDLAEMQINPRMVQIDELINSSLSAVLSFADTKGIALISTASELPVNADPDRIVQVLVNLLSNAVKFSASGSAVRVAVQSVNGVVEVTVQDSGRGVPDDMQETIFERFSQTSLKDGAVLGGSGLGLPICKEIVERHGGRIGVRSQGLGSTFWFTLPAGEKAK